MIGRFYIPKLLGTQIYSVAHRGFIYKTRLGRLCFAAVDAMATSLPTLETLKPALNPILPFDFNPEGGLVNPRCVSRWRFNVR